MLLPVSTHPVKNVMHTNLVFSLIPGVCHPPDLTVTCFTAQPLRKSIDNFLSKSAHRPTKNQQTKMNT